MGVEEIIGESTDQWDVRIKLQRDLTDNYGEAGRDVWDKYYAQEPSYRNTRHHWNELMIDKYIRVYESAIEKLEGSK